MRHYPPGRSILTALPADILVHILDRLPDPSDRKAWRLVCREFLRADYLQRRSLRLLRHGSLPAILRRYGSLERLDLSACPRIDDSAIRAAFYGIRLHALRSVNLSRRSALRCFGLGFMVNACPALETVDLSYCSGVGDREMAALARAPLLRELNVTKCLGVTDVGLARVAVGCSKLERLDLKWCLEISDIGIDLLVKKCRALKDLDISYLKVTNASLQSISSLEKLEVLSMVACSLIDDTGLSYLENGNNCLRSINFSRCDSVSSVGFSSIIKAHSHLKKIYVGHCFPEVAPLFLRKLKDLENSLESIRLDGFHLSSSVLRTIGIHCTNLLEIGLGKCDGITDEGISELSSSCPRLRTVDLTCCRLITDSSLIAIANSCKKLQCLRLESCPGITEKGLGRIGDSCSHLAEIDLTDCGIDDEALKCLSKCCNLIELKLGLCPRITNEGLVYIGSNCKDLQVLDLYRCTGVGDDGLAAIGGGCRKLRKINICYCTQITDRGLEHLCGLDLLTDLEMREVVRVTGAGVTAVAVGCRSLVELDMKKCRSVDDPAGREAGASPRGVGGGYELALRAAWERLQKLKLPTWLSPLLSREVLQMLPDLAKVGEVLQMLPPGSPEAPPLD
ncbi:unnamed protein product [Spirodela intermedia]|uniref:F-box/LRR-repeat protein 15-like leucin rich repeat domain-containing protein n=1 Tax=Spirodela intermedia TaxID=51605 RepID=A0A7I8IBT0_SPIIN|nr:unnamed protein product [Spirodela intermedia]CAA6654331.1 unnamed protein product [Spirodela intermedia]